MVNNSKIKDDVRHKLKNDVRTRDSDLLLASLLWWDELRSAGLDKISAFDFLRMFSQGNFVNYESIRRCRAKIQELDPSLRGKSYADRQKKDKEVKEQLKNF